MTPRSRRALQRLSDWWQDHPNACALLLSISLSLLLPLALLLTNHVEWVFPALTGAPCLIITLELLRRWHFEKRKQRKPIAHVCANCGYDLRATPDCCPECGTAAAPPPGWSDPASPYSPENFLNEFERLRRRQRIIPGYVVNSSSAESRGKSRSAG